MKPHEHTSIAALPVLAAVPVGIALRQLADHGRGVPAFNINNTEQGFAIGEAACSSRCGGKEHGYG
jgi:hypothetical protein